MIKKPDELKLGGVRRECTFVFTDFVGRPIGSLVLKGKSQAVATHEPLTQKQADSGMVKDYLTAFQLLEDKASEVTRVFENLTKKYPKDALSAYHLSRLNAGETGRTIVLPWK